MAGRYSGYNDYNESYDDGYGDDGYSDYGDYAGRYSSSGSSRPSGAYSRSDRNGASSYRRSSRNSDGFYTASSHSNAFSDFYDDEDIESYRRSSYGSGSTSGRRSPRRSLYDDNAVAQRSGSRSGRRTSYESPTPRASASAGTTRRQRSFDFEEQDDVRTSYSRSSSSRRAASSDYGTRRALGSRPYDDEEDYAPKRSNRKRNLIIAAVVVVVLILAGAGMAFAYVNSISDNMHKGVDDDLKNALVHTDMANEPFYMLLLGTDTAEWRKEEQADIADTIRSDSMILARIDPVNKKVALISIDRDTMVDIDGYGTQKINAAYQLGGAAGAVKAVSKMTGLDISHYASVDFDGFSAIVDAIGGIEVDVPMAVDDPEAGGSVEAGLQTLNGEQALILCRSRHAYDDMDTVGGYIRDGYQRIVLGAIAKKVLASDVLTIANTVKEMSQYVTTDLEISDIIGLAQIMQGIDPDADIYTAREPTQSLYIDETWYELLDEEEWAKMISRMEQGLSPSDTVEVDQATGLVLQTTGSKSEASAAAGQVSTEGRRAVNTRDPEAEDEWYGDESDESGEE